MSRPPDPGAGRGGERPAVREAQDRMVGQLVETGQGQMTVERAKEIARDCALRHDGDLPGGATRRR